MIKNVKIDADTHRLLSIAASTLAAQKGQLCAALIRAALENVDKTIIEKHLISVTNNGNSMMSVLDPT